MKIDLLEKAFQNVDHDARPEIGMVISLKTSLCEKVAVVTGQKVTLVLDSLRQIEAISGTFLCKHHSMHMKKYEKPLHGIQLT